MDSAYNCPLYNYTDIIHLSYHLICEQIPSAAYNLSVTCNNYTFYGEEGYIINQPPVCYLMHLYTHTHPHTYIYNFCLLMWLLIIFFYLILFLYICL